LRAVFEAADSGDETLAVDLLNSLLLRPTAFSAGRRSGRHRHRSVVAILVSARRTEGGVDGLPRAVLIVRHQVRVRAGREAGVRCCR
ncbi:hypothetical protein ABZY04_29755, partial [Streptomyces sp. NPDC002922]